MPEEFTDFQLMREMGWTFADLQATPPYVRTFVTDFLAMTAERDQDDDD